jgi:PleD family two-component response regulator
MDGYGLLTSVRSQPESQHVPVILVGERRLSEEELIRVDASLTRVLSGADITRDHLLAVLSELLESAQAAV